MAKTTTRRVRRQSAPSEGARQLSISVAPRRGAHGSKTEAGLYGTTVSCGVRELYGVSHRAPVDLIRGIGDLQHLAHVVFSDVHRGAPAGAGCGENFAQFVQDNKLGAVVRSGVKTNPNSGNRIAVWVWTPNKAAVKRFLAQGV